MPQNKDNRPEAVLDRVLEKAGILPHHNKSVEEVVDEFRKVTDDNLTPVPFTEGYVGTDNTFKAQESWLRNLLQQERQTSQEREREIVEKLIHVVASVDNYANPLTANDCVDQMKEIAQKYNITIK